MFIWACGPIENFPNDEMLLGQVNIKMKALSGDEGMNFLFYDFTVCLSNVNVGEGSVKIIYKTV